MTRRWFLKFLGLAPVACVLPALTEKQAPLPASGYVRMETWDSIVCLSGNRSFSTILIDGQPLWAVYGPKGFEGYQSGWPEAPA